MNQENEIAELNTQLSGCRCARDVYKRELFAAKKIIRELLNVRNKDGYKVIGMYAPIDLEARAINFVNDKK